MAEYLVGTVAEFTDEDRKLVTVGGDEIVVFRHEGEMFALSNVCGHMGGPVGEGMLINRVEGVVDSGGRYLGDRFSTEATHLVCPWHGMEYDIRTGVSHAHPKARLRRYDTEVRGEEVYVRV